MQIPKEAQTRQERRCASARPGTCKHAATRVELMPQGHTHHAREVCAAAWGVDGFTLTDRDAAFAKLREIVASSVLLHVLGKRGSRAALKNHP